MRRLHRLLGAAALLVGAAAPAALAPAPVHATGACTSQGVTVVVDFGALGGGVQQGCASSAGRAAALFTAAGHTLGRVQSQPSAICSVDSKPASPCHQMPPADAYWGLFWTNGSTTKWTYASLGVDSLNVPAGGSVGFAWQSSAGTRAPRFTPAVTKAAAPAAKPTKASKPKSKPTAKATRQPATMPSVTSTPTAAPSMSASVSPRAIASSSPSAKARKKHPRARASVAGSTVPTTPSTSPAATSANSAPISANSGGLPGWVPPVVVVVLLAAGGGVAVARRRARG